MTLRNYERSNLTDPKIQDLEYRIEEAFRPITDSSIIDGRLISDIELASGTVSKIAHKLGRAIRGWVVVGKNAAQHVYDDNSGQSDLDTFIHLTAGGTVTVNVWVF
tara:strand:- start:1259 stop:1576 length:318 start_codon:yes stop_codon:yes gene_type:complete